MDRERGMEGFDGQIRWRNPAKAKAYGTGIAFLLFLLLFAFFALGIASHTLALRTSY